MTVITLVIGSDNMESLEEPHDYIILYPHSSLAEHKTESKPNLFVPASLRLTSSSVCSQTPQVTKNSIYWVHSPSFSSLP